jgi:ATP-dependent DNA helicase PIF1
MTSSYSETEQTLNDLQQKAYDRVLEGKNIFLTGLAGSGKSRTVKQLKTALEKKSKNTAITSLTGISANLIGGITLHSYLGIQLGTGSFKRLYDMITKNPKILARWRRLDVLIIDEVSMLSIELFEKLNKLAKAIRYNKSPFGGIQIVLTGDFCQLAPIAQDEFIFESPVWSEVIDEVIYLTEIIRQSDEIFTRVLNKVRLADIDEEVEQVLKSREIKYISKTGLIPTMIYSTNQKVYETNMKYYKKLTSEEHKYKIKYIWNKNVIYKEKYDQLVRFEPELCLKIGAQVVHLVNQDGLFNGSRGVVKDFIDGYPSVLFTSGAVRVISPTTLNVEEQDEVIMTYTQIPLKLAFAGHSWSTVGSSLDLVRIDFRNIFAYGQAYVALSRVKSLDGLYIRNLNTNLIKCHPKAKLFYKNLENNISKNITDSMDHISFNEKNTISESALIENNNISDCSSNSSEKSESYKTQTEYKTESAN